MDPKSSEANEVEVFATSRAIVDPARRAAYLGEACRGNAALRQQVEELLALEAEADREFEPAARQAPGIIAAALSRTQAGPAPEGPGDRIGPYQLVRKLGEGGCGVVYLAEQHHPIRREVALKVIKLGMDTRHVVARFEAERQALAVMDHPHIAKVLDAGTTMTGRPYFVMELVQGVRITEFCDRATMSMLDRLQLVVQVCQAVQHAHQKGIIHRDLKPSNVMVSILDGRAVPKVIDFGIAKAAAGQRLTDQTTYTAVDQFVGTPAYMSPEQADLNGVDIDTRSDIYSLGVLLYELLTGRTPFAARELLDAGFDEMRRTICEKEPTRPSTQLASLVDAERNEIARSRRLDALRLTALIRGDLDWIVMKCLEKDRNRRYDTANALAQDLTRYLQHEPVTARPPSRLYQFRKLARRHRLVFSSVAIVLLALSVGLLVSLTQYNAARRAHNLEEIARSTAVRDRDRAQAAEHDTRIVLEFFLDNVIGAASPQPERGGLGKDATIRMALMKAEPEIAITFSNKPAVEASVRQRLGRSFRELGDYSAAVAQYERALHLWRSQAQSTSSSSNHSAVLQLVNVMDDLALMYHSRGQTNEAVTIRKEALARSIEAFGTNATRTIQVKTWLGIDFRGLGRKVEAVQQLSEALLWSQLAYGSNDLRTLETMNHLAVTYQAAGKLPQAVEMLKQVLEQRRRILGLADVATSRAMIDLARMYQSMGEWNSALPLYLQGLKAREDSLSPSHYEVWLALDAVARAYLWAGKPTEAIPYLERVVELRKKTLPPDHPEVTQALRILASAYSRSGQVSNALALVERIPGDTQGARTKNGFSTVEARLELTLNLTSVGRWTEATAQVPTLLTELAAARQATGFLTSSLETRLDSLAGEFMRGRRNRDAERLLQELLASLQAHLPVTNEQVLSVVANLGQSLIYEGWSSIKRGQTNDAVRAAHDAERHFRALSEGRRLSATNSLPRLDADARLAGAFILVASADPDLREQARLEKLIEAEASLLRGHATLQTLAKVPHTLVSEYLRRLERLYSCWELLFPFAGKTNELNRWTRESKNWESAPRSTENVAP